MSLPARAARWTGPLVLALSACASVAGCGRAHRHESRESVERAVIARRREGLAGLVAAAEKGPLVPFDGILVVVDQAVVQGLLQSAMPYERIVGGKYRVRVTSGDVKFEDGTALVQLEGRASFADRAEEDARAEVTLAFTVDVLELDPESGVLRGAVRVLAMDARRVDVMGVRTRLVERLVEDLARERLETFGALLSRIEVPVALEREVTLPAVGPEGGVKIDRAALPFRAAVTTVRAFQRRLWVTVDVAEAQGNGDGPAKREAAR